MNMERWEKCKYLLDGMISVEEGESMPPACPFAGQWGFFCNKDEDTDCPVEDQIDGDAANEALVEMEVDGTKPIHLDEVKRRLGLNLL